MKTATTTAIRTYLSSYSRSKFVVSWPTQLASAQLVVDQSSRKLAASATNLELMSYLNQREPVIVNQRGRYKAVLVPVETEADVERPLMAGNKRLMEILRESDRNIDESSGILHDEFWRRIDAKYTKQSNGKQMRKVEQSCGKSLGL